MLSILGMEKLFCAHVCVWMWASCMQRMPFRYRVHDRLIMATVHTLTIPAHKGELGSAVD